MADAKTIKVLVVEDDSDLLDAYKAVFSEKNGFEGRFTHDGGHAAGILANEAFQAAVLDIKLPTMNGLQVAAGARSSQLNRRIPIFIVSGFVDDQAHARANSLGIIKLIEKPVAAEELCRIVKESVGGQKKVSGYDVRIINAILKASREVLEFYYNVPVQMDKPAVRRSNTKKHAGSTGLIGISGETFAGSLAIVSSYDFAQSLAVKIFQNEHIKLDHEMVADLIGETCNQVCGRLKIAFAELGIKSNIGLPEVVIGDDHVVVHKVDNPVLYVSVQVSGVTCEIEFCLAERSGFDVDESKAEQAVSGVLLFD